MPVIKVNDQQYSLHAGQNKVGVGADADVRVGGDAALGIQAVIDVSSDQAVIRRMGSSNNTVKVNGIPLGDPTPLIHGDKVEVAGQELLYSDDKKVGATQFVSAGDVAAISQKRGGPARATAATGGRLVSLVDGKEYNIPAGGIVIGRDASSGVVVAQNEVSRKHAEVVPVADGYEVRDLSANGVWVNGTRVQKSHVLSRADVIRVGTEELRFYADTAGGVPGAPTPVAGARPVTPPAGAKPAAPAKPPVENRPLLASLEVMNGVTKGSQHSLHVPLAHIGRGAHNDIVVDDDSVSDSHAKLQRRDDGWYVVDMESTNGTYVGGQRIVGERKLEGAPDLRFGGIKMIFRAKDSGPSDVKGTRAIAPIDRSKLAARATQQTAPLPQTPPTTAAASAPVETKSGGIPVWVWIVVALAVVGAAAYFMLMKKKLMARLLHAARTDVGMIRSGNEDNFAVNAGTDRGLFIVADGMGGHAAGEVASEMAVQIIELELSGVRDLDDKMAEERVTDALRKANRNIHDRTIHEVDKQGMGTTASVLLLSTKRYLIGQVGDSRVYLLRDGALTQITKDHSYVQEQVDAGFLTPEQARYHPYSNVITRCVGASPDVQPDTYTGDVRVGDLFLVASDGLTGMVDDRRLQVLLGSRAEPERKVHSLISEANGRGGLDNITAIVVQIAPEDDGSAVLATQEISAQKR